MKIWKICHENLWIYEYFSQCSIIQLVLSASRLWAHTHIRLPEEHAGNMTHISSSVNRCSAILFVTYNSAAINAWRGGRLVKSRMLTVDNDD